MHYSDKYSSLDCTASAFQSLGFNIVVMPAGRLSLFKINLNSWILVLCSFVCQVFGFGCITKCSKIFKSVERVAKVLQMVGNVPV